nr:hypothetical protein [Nostoc sp. SerVER01]
MIENHSKVVEEEEEIDFVCESIKEDLGFENSTTVVDVNSLDEEEYENYIKEHAYDWENK